MAVIYPYKGAWRISHMLKALLPYPKFIRMLMALMLPYKGAHSMMDSFMDLLLP
jgi:hypothetical protein